MLRALFKKDVICLCREKEFFLAAFALAVLLVVAVNFALQGCGFGEEEFKTLSPALISLTFIFSAVLGLNYSFLYEEQNQALTGVLLTPVALEKVFLAKFAANVLFLALVQTVVLVVYAVLFNMDLVPLVPGLLVVEALFIVGFAALGTLFSSIAVSTRGREILLPLLLFPLLLPLLAGTVFLMRDLFTSGALDWSSFWLKLVLGFDLLSFVLGLTLFEFSLRG